MLGRAFYGCPDLRLNLGGFPLKLRGREPLVAQPHRQREQEDESGNKPLNLAGIREFLFQVFHLPQKVGIAVLKGTGGLIVPGITIRHQNPRKGVSPKDRLGHGGRSRLAELKDAELLDRKEPSIAILSFGSP